MQQLTDGLQRRLSQAGVEFAFSSAAADFDCDDPLVIGLSANAAGECLSAIAPELSRQLRAVEMLSLVTATAFYPAAAAKLKGFGCLFPRDQGFRARGVLFNNSIFDSRGPAHSETWIFGGALDSEIVALPDEEIGKLIANDREKFYGQRTEPVALCISRRPNAIPHYSLELEAILTKLSPPPSNVALVGNYLGRIGLAKLIERAAAVAERFVSSLQ